MNTAYLLIGGNMGEREDNLETARRHLEANCGTITKSSSLYETAAWGKEDQPSFLNQALELETKLNARQLIRKVLKIEKNMGRVRKEKLGPRTIDIDILFFNNEVENTSFLVIPHPEMHNRRFVLEPLAEIAPEATHPIFKKTVSALLSECKDSLAVNKYFRLHS